VRIDPPAGDVVSGEPPVSAREPRPFSIVLFAGWPDMDFNQHMRNVAYLWASENCRMQFLAQGGFTMDEFRKRMLGPVVLEDRLVYKKEIKLLEEFRVAMALAAITPDGRRMRVRNSIYRTRDGELAAVVESVMIWFDLSARKPVEPFEELKAAWFGLERTEDFAWF
jgi:acyl-CoA thioester hydrolase